MIAKCRGGEGTEVFHSLDIDFKEGFPKPKPNFILKVCILIFYQKFLTYT